jgi:hypothetical protein
MLTRQFEKLGSVLTRYLDEANTVAIAK